MLRLCTERHQSLIFEDLNHESITDCCSDLLRRNGVFRFRCPEINQPQGLQKLAPFPTAAAQRRWRIWRRNCRPKPLKRAPVRFALPPPGEQHPVGHRRYLPLRRHHEKQSLHTFAVGLLLAAASGTALASSNKTVVLVHGALPTAAAGTSDRQTATPAYRGHCRSAAAQLAERGCRRNPARHRPGPRDVVLVGHSGRDGDQRGG